LRYKEAGKKGNYAKFIEDSNLNWSVDHAKIRKYSNKNTENSMPNILALCFSITSFLSFFL
jgi:hypothetical protein